MDASGGRLTGQGIMVGGGDVMGGRGFGALFLSSEPVLWAGPAGSGQFYLCTLLLLPRKNFSFDGEYSN